MIMHKSMHMNVFLFTDKTTTKFVAYTNTENMWVWMVYEDNKHKHKQQQKL